MDTFTELKDILESRYIIKVKSISSLPGYDDQNFLILDQNGSKFICKLAEVSFLNAIRIQCEILTYLSGKNDISTPTLVNTIKEEQFFEVSYQEKPCIARLQSYLEGTLLSYNQNFSQNLTSNFGTFLGKLNKYLIDYNGDLPPEVAYIWNIKYTSLCRTYYRFIQDPEIRRLIQYFVLQFEEKVFPQLHNLRTSIIHGDAHTWNVLAKDDDITGIIDFGDLSFSNTIFEAAIALSYLTIDANDILSTSAHFVAAYHKIIALKAEEISLLYYMITARLSISLCMSSFKMKTEPDNQYALQGREKICNFLKMWHQINPILFEDKMREACGMQPVLKLDANKILSKRRNLFSKSQSISYDNPIYMTGASMQYMYDDSGNTYLDCVNNICHVGHCHPKVVEAGQAQMAKLNTNTRYLYKSLDEYAEKLLSKFPSSFDKIFLVNSGSAATDLAYRLARNFTEKKDFIVMENAYHGNTDIAVQLSPYKFDGAGGHGKAKFVKKINMPDSYREGNWEKNISKSYKLQIDEIFQSNDAAAFITESILGCGGQILLPDSFIQNIYKLCKLNDVLYIADEVQIGFGRVGHHFWGFELYDVIPDIVILGKPMGNGHPIGAVVTNSEITHSFENGMEFFSSFGGNPVSCEIGKAVLDVIEEESLQQHAKEMETYILNQWRELQNDFEIIGDVRGKGLFLGMEIVHNKSGKIPNPGGAKKIVERMKKQFILLSTDGPSKNVIKFKPPMVFHKENADSLYNTFYRVLKSL